MIFKKTYTPEELQELVDWMTQRLPTMPESLQLNKATYISNLKRTTKDYLDLVKLHANNPTYGGQLHHLFEIRQRLEEMEQKEANKS